MEFGTLEKTFKIAQRLQVALLSITNITKAVASDSTAVLVAAYQIDKQTYRRCSGWTNECMAI